MVKIPSIVTACHTWLHRGCARLYKELLILVSNSESALELLMCCFPKPNLECLKITHFEACSKYGAYNFSAAQRLLNLIHGYLS